MAAGGGAVIAVLVAAAFGFARTSEIPSMVFIALVGAVGAVILEFLIRFLIVAPAKIQKENEKIISDLRANQDRAAMADKMADLLISLESRLADVRTMTVLEFRNCLRAGEDLDSHLVLNEVSDFVALHYGKARAATFESTLEFQLTPISPQDRASDLYLIMPEIFAKQYFMIDILTFRAKKLAQIIKEEGA